MEIRASQVVVPNVPNTPLPSVDKKHSNRAKLLLGALFFFTLKRGNLKFYKPDGHDYQTYMIMWMNLVDNPRNWSFNPWFIIYSLVIYRFAIENGHKIVDVPIKNGDFL
jgi:hypothetical protein